MKSKIRSQIIESRDSQPVPEIEKKSRMINERFLSMPLVEKANSVFVYNSIRGEVRTRKIIETFLAQGKKVTVPIVDLDANRIIIARLDSIDDLRKSTFGIPEPVRTEPVPIEEIDLIVVPGIAFDEKGGRVGHGFGFYDKLLGTIKDKPIVALAYEMQVLSEVPCEAHDVKLNKIVTENRVIECD